MSGINQEDIDTSQFEVQLAAAMKGDGSQLGLLLHKYRAYLLSIADAKLSRGMAVKAAPSDLVQEVLLRASKSFEGFRGTTEGEMRLWLRRILTRELIDVHRHYLDYGKRDVAREVRLTDCDTSEFFAPTESPSARARMAEDMTILRECLNRLTDGQRQIIELRNFAQLDFDEIATELEKTVATVRRMWSRAVRNLAREVSRYESKPQ